MDHDVGLVVKNEGFLAFVHSGFGIYIDSKHNGEYPPAWGKAGGADSDDRQRRELDVAATDATQRATAYLVHSLKGSIAPLAAINLQLKEALKNGDTRLAYRMCEMSETAQKRIQAMLERTRSVFASYQVSTNESASLAEAIRSAASISDQIDVRIELRGIEPVGHLKVIGSEGIIVSVFTELFMNAAHAGAQMIERAAVSGKRPPSVRVFVTVEIDWDSQLAICHVEDDGPGIPEHVERRVFDAFVSGSSAGRPTTGIGLYFVHRVMEALGGRIELIPSGRRGAHFVLKFMLAKDR